MADQRNHIAPRRKKLKERLVAEGKYDAFKVRVQALKRESGFADHICEISVSRTAEFQPANGDCEFSHADYENELRRYRPDLVEGTTPQQGALPLTPDQMKLLNAPRNAERVERQWESLRKDVADIWKRRKQRVGADELSQIRWALGNALTPVSDIDPYSVPGVGAIKLLIRIQSSDSVYDDYAKAFYSRMLTKALDADPEFAYGAQGNRHLTMMERLRDIDAGDDIDTVASIMSDELDDETMTPVSAAVPDDEQGEPPDDVHLEEEVPGLGGSSDGLQSESGLSDSGLESGGSLDGVSE